jgi:hypothetical protein
LDPNASLLAETKQVTFILFIAFLLFSIFNFKRLDRVILFLTGSILFASIFYWAIYNIEILSPYTTWIRPEIYGPDGDATNLRLSGIRLVLSHYTSPLHPFLGLGPGHTIDRLGGWMLRDYENILKPLGATRTTIGDDTWSIINDSWLRDGSSFFAPFFTWAGLWGNLGLLGVISYVYISSIVWRKFCVDDLSRYLIATVFVFGFVFTQVEEPGYMLVVTSIIGLRWQEHRAEAIAAEERYQGYQLLQERLYDQQQLGESPSNAALNDRELEGL